ncbi:MAG: methylenetetrahydrofolate reductase [Desulfobacterales bacterium]|nr:methylenetetrahydrofolate reductase [Desulfobacterales bacterium]
MDFRKSLSSGKFVITSEVGPPAIPPKGVDISQMLEFLEPLKERVHAYNITDLKSSVMRMSALAVAHILKEEGFDPILHFTCRDRNRLALQADLLGAWALGIENILVITGDDVTFGDHPEAKPVFDLDSLKLLDTVKRLNEGFDLAGNELQGRPDFFVGAGLNIMIESEGALKSEIAKMERKVMAGAKFFQTSPVYDIGSFEKFIREVEHIRVPIIAGIMLLKSASMARFMNKNIDNVFIPEDLIAEMEKAKSRVEVSMAIAARLIKELKNLCQGVYLMPIGWEKNIPAVLDAAEL